MSLIRYLPLLPLSLALPLSACGDAVTVDDTGGTGGTDTGGGGSATVDVGGSGGTGQLGGAGGGTDPGPEADWHAQLTGPQSQDSMAMTIDGDGRVVVAGSSAGVADLGAGYDVGPAAEGLFVTVFNQDGTTAFVRRFPAVGVTCTDVQTDAEGNIVVTGLFSNGPLELGDIVLTPTGQTDGFVGKLDRDGHPLWAHAHGEAETFSVGGAIAIDPQGTIFHIGNQGAELYVARISAAGEVVFEHREGSIFSPFSFFSAAKAAVVGADDHLYVTGTFGSGAVLGPMVSDDGGQKVFVASLSPWTGEPLWAKAFGDPKAYYSNEAGGIAVEPGGDVIVSGSFAGTMDLGGGALPGNVFVTRLSSLDGEHVWSHGFGQEPKITQVATAPGGRLLLMSSLTKAAEIAGATMPPGSYLAEVSAETGDLLGTRPLPEIGSMISTTQHGFFGLGEMAVGPGGEAAVMSSFFGPYSTSLGTFESAGWSDVFVVHLSAW